VTSDLAPTVRGRLLKHLKKIVLAVLLVVVLLVVLAVLWINQLAKAGIEFAGTSALGVATTVDRVAIGILSGSCQLSGLQVANPPGFKSSHFLRLKEGTIDVALGSILKDTVEVPLLTLRGIEVNLVRENGPANFRTIVDNIARFEASRNQTDEPPPDEKSRKKFIFHEVVIEDVSVFIDLLPLGGKLTQLTVPIDEIRLTNVGSEGNNGETLARVTAIVVKALLDAIITKGENILPPELLSELREKIADLKPLKTLRANILERLSTEGRNGPLRTRRQERIRRRQEPSQ